MCSFYSDATSSHTMSRPQQYLIGNTSQLNSLQTLNKLNLQSN